MNQQEILKKIGGIIAELKEQHNYLEASVNSFNALELELFMANANFLSDHIEILKKIHGQLPTAILPPVTPTLSAEKVYGQRPEIPDYFSEKEQLLYAEDDVSFSAKEVSAPEIIELQLPENTEPEITKTESVILLPEEMPQVDVNAVSVIADDASFIKQKLVTEEPVEELSIPKVEFLPEVIVQPEKEFEPVVYVEEKQPEIVIKEETAKAPEPTISAAEPVLTLNQRIAAQKNIDQPKTTATESIKKPVHDLQSMISLNDKLLFVRELFNGYNLAYTEAINILNRYTTFDQAEKFLNQNYSVKNNWKEKPATAERFFDLLRKRFS